MWAQIWNLFRKELIQFRRDRLLTPFIILGPVFQLFMLAAATGTDASQLPMAIVDQDHTKASRALIAAFGQARDLDMRGILPTTEIGSQMIDHSQIMLLVVIPTGFEAALGMPSPPVVQVIVDGSNGLVAQTLRSVSQGVLARFGQQMALAAGGGLPSAGIDLRPQVRYNPTLNFRFTALPAQLGLIVYMVTMLTASLGIARERERGTMEQLMVTPIRKLELMIGKGIPVLAIALMDFSIMLLVVVGIYDVPLRGSLGLLFGLTALYVLVEMGVGLTLSSIARSQQQSLLLVFLLGSLNVAFSGYLVPVKNMPWLLNRLSYLFPVQHYMTILRVIMLKGAGLAEVAGHALALAGLGVLILGLAYRVMQSRLD